ncbi:hypothetical protein FBY03_13927 [Pseudomonas sp. SJZ079]|uniref:hypothetical protein n=1 Tax=Pseudomonas sp. SJZ079 TaxID=2572887 RepID=UPI00119AF937|nr:hypothetical protein [Pseudomonas sp. SJZ079]TWC28197.1 hypothetical protein FBY03_13927 [Pseudomonas sp. SJZ079]
MNRSSIHNERSVLVPPAEGDWPRDFDFREAYAEQRELLESPADRAVNSTTSTSAENHA